jgi:hypothetical protein
MALGEIALVRPGDFLQDALKIVPGVIEDTIREEDEDRMEIDSGAPNKTGAKRESVDTLASCVQCLLQCLNSDTPAESGKGALIFSNPKQ